MTLAVLQDFDEDPVGQEDERRIPARRRRGWGPAVVGHQDEHDLFLVIQPLKHEHDCQVSLSPHVEEIYVTTAEGVAICQAAPGLLKRQKDLLGAPGVE